jgi:hypothetical protein
MRVCKGYFALKIILKITEYHSMHRLTLTPFLKNNHQRVACYSLAIHAGCVLKFGQNGVPQFGQPPVAHSHAGCVPQSLANSATFQKVVWHFLANPRSVASYSLAHSHAGCGVPTLHAGCELTFHNSHHSFGVAWDMSSMSEKRKFSIVDTVKKGVFRLRNGNI